MLNWTRFLLLAGRLRHSRPRKFRPGNRLLNGAFHYGRKNYMREKSRKQLEFVNIAPHEIICGFSWWVKIMQMFCKTLRTFCFVCFVKIPSKFVEILGNFSKRQNFSDLWINNLKGQIMHKICKIGADSLECTKYAFSHLRDVDKLKFAVRFSSNSSKLSW